MPSHDHESRLMLFRNQPTLAADLIGDAFDVELPPYRQAEVTSADLTDIQPAEYRADMVIQLRRHSGVVYAIILEVQLSVDRRKRFVWPAYAANLRARLECPVALLVVTASEAVARWAMQPVHLGGTHYFAPYVLRPSAVPELTDEAKARESPEFAVLSVMAHGRIKNTKRAAEIALVAERAVVGLDADRSAIYLDLIHNSLSEAARAALSKMDAQKYVFKSDFALKYIAVGREQGRADFAALIIRQLTSRFGKLGSRIEARIQRATSSKLKKVGERLLTARTLKGAIRSL